MDDFLSEYKKKPQADEIRNAAYAIPHKSPRAVSPGNQIGGVTARRQTVAETRGSTLETASGSAKIQKGSRVFDLGNASRHGTVLTLGPQVSEVRYDDGSWSYVSNNYLDLIKP